MAPTPRELIWFIGRSSKRIAVTVVGAGVLAAGVAMLVLPGPGILVIALGFGILGTEYAWAASAFEKTKRRAERAGRAAKGAVSGRIRRRPPAGTPGPGEQAGVGPSGAEPPGGGSPGGGSPAPPP